ncbi:sulfotransferase family 2 domain-containing protein [Tranquillimonas rosea]|uniref:sulfotransferase family 2 domain-containing protein n=1 Tax=Tranquillimonas rosea TaxID=641238 RepID=UPI003BA858DE
MKNRLDRMGSKLGWQLFPGRMIQRASPRPDPRLEEVYLSRGLILIHIPKNAGTSVEDAIYGYRVRHRTWEQVQALCPTAWETLPKAAIIRDPVDRFLSAFDYLKSGGRNESDRRFAARMIGSQSVDAFLERLVTDAALRELALEYFHLRRQADYVCSPEAVMVDHLIPFERMAEGLSAVAGVPPDALQHSNRTRGQRTRKEHLAHGSLDHIRGLYAPDIALYDRALAAWPANAPRRPAVAEPT